MPGSLPRFAVVASVCAGVPFGALAQAQIWSEPEPVRFEMLTLADGLSDSTIFSISQDRGGRIWLGSASGGANVFDGYRIEAFRHLEDDPQSLAHSGAGEVLATRDGEVLVGTWGGGLNRRLDIDGRFEPLNPGAAPTHIQAMLEDRESVVWIGSADSGLWRLGDDRRQLERVLRPDGEPFDRIWSIAEGPPGTVWVATPTGLFEVGEDDPVAAPAGGWRRHPRTLVHDGDRLWAADGEAIYRLEGGVPVPVIEGLPLINTLARSPDGQILVGTLAGIHALAADGRRAAPFNGTEMVLFPERQVRRFLFDQSGVGWIATREAGVIKAQPTVPGFDGHPLESELDTADAILELSPDDVLVGSRRGLWRLRRNGDGSKRFYRVPGTEPFSIIRFARRSDEVLLATRNGILRFDPELERLDRDARFAAHDDQMVTALRSNPDGSVDVGSWAAGLYRYRVDGSVHRFAPDTESAIPDFSISDIEPDGDGGVWVGLYTSGVAHIDAAGSIRLLDLEALEVDGNVHDVLVLDDALWVATSFGLARHDLSAGTSERLVLMPDFPTNAVQRLAAGAQRLWAATTRGLMAIDLEDGSVTRFGTSDGLVVDEFFARSGDRGQDGRIYFGGLGGFVSFLPEQVELSLEAPSASVVAAWVNGNPVPIQAGIELPPLADSLRLRFLAADYREATANRFRWRLVPAEAEDEPPWGEVSADPEAFFVGLDPGRYRFELQAANSNGLWNARAAGVPVVVQPAWWQTRWGQAAIALAAVLLAWAWNYWNTYRIRVRNRELEAEVGQQTEALRRANRSLEEAASTDYLTKLLNRRGFLAQVRDESSTEDHCFAILDVDNFKHFNDRFGHETGDRVLQHVADLLKDRVREGDVVGRWGGEEFIARLHAVDRASAVEAAERLRKAVAAGPLARGGDIPAITVTIGIARHAPGTDRMETIRRADARLLAGKEQGKNRVVAED